MTYSIILWFQTFMQINTYLMLIEEIHFKIGNTP